MIAAKVWTLYITRKGIFMYRKMNLREKIKSYKLGTQVTIAFILFAVFVISVLVYQIPSVRADEIAANLILALFTSILVSVITLVVDIIVEFNRHKNDAYLESLREFGIGNLYLDKESVLRDLFHDCDRNIWISGYRLILTNKLKKDIHDSIVRGADFNAVICPPWTEAFKMVYGSNEKVLDNYLSVFSAVNKARKEVGKTPAQVQVVFVNKPIFSDTYRVDQRLVTGPYMHNKDDEYNVLMAKDFFSYDLVRKSRLSELIHDEYVTLYKEAYLQLDWDKFDVVYDKIVNSDMRESEKIEELLSACVDHTLVNIG